MQIINSTITSIIRAVNSSTSFNDSIVSMSNSTLVTINQPSLFRIIDDFLRLYGYVYLFPIVSVIGLIANSLCLIVLASPKLTGDTFKYQILKIAIHSMVLLVLALSPYSNCRSCPTFGTMVATILRYVGLIFITGFGYTSASVAEIMLTYDQLLLFKQKSKFFVKIPFKISAIIIVGVGFFLNLPNLFAFRLQPVANSTRVSLLPSSFGFTEFYLYYTIVINILQSLVTFAVLVVLNSLMSFEFKKYIAKKKNLVNKKLLNLNINTEKKNESQIATKSTDISQNNNIRTPSKSQSRARALPKVQTSSKEVDQNENAIRNFTLMIIIGSIIFMISRLIQLIASIIAETGRIYNIQQDIFSIFYSFFNILTTLIVFGLNLILNYFFNKSFKAQFKKFIFQCQLK
jgi:ABC-type multidrug transport system fused ATPase/permease subunit